MLDPWIFRRIEDHVRGQPVREPTGEEKVRHLRRHFELMTQQHGDYSCVLFRKFAAWYGARLGIPEDLEDRLRTFNSAAEFEELASQIAERQGERAGQVATALIRVPNGPVEKW
jgi:tRNA-dihydrouridine synthase